MKRIIEEVFEAEEKVSAILRQAQMQASEIRQSAEREISESLGSAKDQARQIIQAAVEQARIEAERIREEKLREAESTCNGLVGNGARNLNSLVETLCQVIRTTEHETDSH